MSDPTNLASLTEDGFSELLNRSDDGPVTMLNLLAFKPDGGRRRYAEYGRAVMPLLERAGARILFEGDAGSALIGPDSWDLVLLVEYPTNGAFLAMIRSPEYQAIGHLRSEALLRGDLQPLYSQQSNPRLG